MQEDEFFFHAHMLRYDVEIEVGLKLLDTGF